MASREIDLNKDQAAKVINYVDPIKLKSLAENYRLDETLIELYPTDFVYFDNDVRKDSSGKRIEKKLKRRVYLINDEFKFMRGDKFYSVIKSMKTGLSNKDRVFVEKHKNKAGGKEIYVRNIKTKEERPATFDEYLIFKGTKKIMGKKGDYLTANEVFKLKGLEIVKKTPVVKPE